MDTFVSWSGRRSRAFAEAVVEWLRSVLYLSHPWMSDQIEPGAKWSEIVGSKLGGARLGIICITPENVDAPWLVFEAGALSNRFGDVHVVPLLFDMRPSDLHGPLAQFQALTFGRDSMLTLGRMINGILGRQKVDDDVLKKSISWQWRNLSTAVEKASLLPIESTTIPQVLKALRKRGLPEPSEGRSLNFDKGFESHQLYEALFSQVRKRLYVFGRKNRKVFDKEHDDFFANLAARSTQGFDFRCLFLSPNAPKNVVAEAHGDPTFVTELKDAIVQARLRLKKHNLSHDKFCRTYKVHRPHAVIVMDELVLFAPTGVDTEGKVKPLTKAPFKIVDSSDSFGRELLDMFIAAWNNGKPLPAAF